MKPKVKDIFKRGETAVFKLGSSLIAGEDGVRTDWIDSLAEECKELISRGVKPVIVSSGAIALGRGILGLGNKTLTLAQKQAASAVGQVSLSSLFQTIFNIKKIKTAQVLLTRFTADPQNKEAYQNAVNTMSVLLDMGVVPVINENDVVATEEIKFGDNDRLGAVVARMTGADILFLFSDIDGLYDKDPKTNKDAKFIPLITEITPEIEAMAESSKNPLAAGGMVTKIIAGKMCLEAGCKMVIMHGKAQYPLARLADGERCTWFIPSSPRPKRERAGLPRRSEAKAG
ncbi:MAG: glutamate 5-kinase [Elusimicrobium sp.]|nr:glutamate 5-kinase [Elusimicrobium sp.]